MINPLCTKTAHQSDAVYHNHIVWLSNDLQRVPEKHWRSQKSCLAYILRLWKKAQHPFRMFFDNAIKKRLIGDYIYRFSLNRHSCRCCIPICSCWNPIFSIFITQLMTCGSVWWSIFVSGLLTSIIKPLISGVNPWAPARFTRMPKQISRIKQRYKRRNMLINV